MLPDRVTTILTEKYSPKPCSSLKESNQGACYMTPLESMLGHKILKSAREFCQIDPGNLGKV